MKEQALYHLMQLRARQLQESLTSGQRDALSEIRESLHIERSEGGYLLRWRLAGIDYRYRPEHDNFSFYIKGDGKKSSAETADMSGYREVNWRAAYSLWLEIYKISGLDVDILHESDALAFSKRTALPDRKTLSIDLIAAALFAAAAGLYVDINTGLQVLLCTFIMLRLAGCFEHVHLRHRTRLSEKVIIAAGTLTPILFGAGLIGLIPLLLAMYLVCLAERSGNTYWFIGSGVVFALAIPYLLWVAATIFICLLVLMRLLTLVDKQRLRL
ncbi:MAG: hypothetical protein OEY07_13145, partial [Gammaproteobacteria bacterium]|nr:hypothetical protein [Gammaproteobacteria bacterium]